MRHSVSSDIRVNTEVLELAAKNDRLDDALTGQLVRCLLDCAERVEALENCLVPREMRLADDTGLPAGRPDNVVSLAESREKKAARP